MGDYFTCVETATNGMYVLATIKGEYIGEYPYTRGSFGKYLDFSTQMGLCVPKQCNEEAL